jgi:hypothetical protein
LKAATQSTVAGRVNAWVRLVSVIEHGYDDDIYEYANDLYCRNWIHEAWLLLEDHVVQLESRLSNAARRNPGVGRSLTALLAVARDEAVERRERAFRLCLCAGQWLAVACGRVEVDEVAVGVAEQH